MDESPGSFSAPFVYLRVGSLEPTLRLLVHQRIPQWRAIIRRALENRESANFFGDNRDELDRGRSGANHRNSLAGEIDLSIRPSGGVERLALEAVDALERRNIARR